MIGHYHPFPIDFFFLAQGWWRTSLSSIQTVQTLTRTSMDRRGIHLAYQNSDSISYRRHHHRTSNPITPLPQQQQQQRSTYAWVSRSTRIWRSDTRRTYSCRWNFRFTLLSHRRRRRARTRWNRSGHFEDQSRRNWWYPTHRHRYPNLLRIRRITETHHRALWNAQAYSTSNQSRYRTRILCLGWGIGKVGRECVVGGVYPMREKE